MLHVFLYLTTNITILLVPSLSLRMFGEVLPRQANIGTFLYAGNPVGAMLCLAADEVAVASV